jgi:chromosome segregation ATPase
MQRPSSAGQWSRPLLSSLQVTSYVLPASVVEAARRLSNGRAVPALDLLSYDARLAPAVQYAFGGVLVCQVRGTRRARRVVTGRGRVGRAGVAAMGGAAARKGC